MGASSLKGPSSITERRSWCWRWDRVALCLLAASLAPRCVPAAEAGEGPVEQEWSLGLAKRAGDGFWNRFSARISDSYPPWAGEAPGAAGARFGLGLDSFLEHQESLRITSMEQTLRARDLLTGREEAGVIHTDPGLLNRKFDIRWDLAGVGSQSAVSLPSLLGIYPTLVFQAAAADVSLDFNDRNRPADTSSLNGRGPLFGTGFDLTRSLCPGCPWFAGTSYRFQRLPSLTVGRSPPFGPPGFEILEDEVRLSRDVQEASTRVGYGFSGHPVVSYVGVSHRWTHLKIEDHLRYRDAFREVETVLSSRTALESEVTMALTGVEARLGPRLFGRTEASVGEKDWGLLLRVVYLPAQKPGRTTDQEAADIAAKIRRIRADFLRAFDALPEVVELAAVAELLRRTEERLLAVLPFPEFAAMQDYVRDRFEKARAMLAREAAGGTVRLAFPAVRGRIVPAALVASRTMSNETAAKRELTGVSSWILSMFDSMIAPFEKGDIRVNVCVKSIPTGAKVFLYPISYRDGGDQTLSDNIMPNLPRGLYAYDVIRYGYEELHCPAGGSADCKLNLVAPERPSVKCVLKRKSEAGPEAICFVVDAKEGCR